MYIHPCPGRLAPGEKAKAKAAKAMKKTKDQMHFRQFANDACSADTAIGLARAAVGEGARSAGQAHHTVSRRGAIGHIADRAAGSMVHCGIAGGARR